VAYAAVSLALPLSVPASDAPLMSLPRFMLVALPLWIALAAVGRRAWGGSLSGRNIEPADGHRDRAVLDLGGAAMIRARVDSKGVG
jgi:hypothetical protein